MSQSQYNPHSTGVSDFAHGMPSQSSPLSAIHHPQQSHYDDGAPSFITGDDGAAPRPPRSASTASTAVPLAAPSRSNTLKKKQSATRLVTRSASQKSLKRSTSRKSLAPGGIGGMAQDGSVDGEDYYSALYTPIPTTGTPTEVLANRFQSWRQLLKSLITYFRELQGSYDTRAKSLHKVQSTLSAITTTTPAIFASTDGLGDATRMLADYHTRQLAEANKSRDIENDVIAALTGLRSDLGQKIKEIKSLSGDFKNSVAKEQDATRREIEKLKDALQHADHDDGGATGRNDPFVVKLGVERCVEKQIDEENYLHRAYLNLEASARELESIIVGEIQKAHNAFASILTREAGLATSTATSLREGPIAMPKDYEWDLFVAHDPHFVAPTVPVRKAADISYPGKDSDRVVEVRAGMLERKGKYLKSYTPGWYVLSPTHLHEFKSAEKIFSQPPVMSLPLLEQKLGSRSEPNSSSHKFMLKGKQSGAGHKGHNWVFRAESYDTMMAWYSDISTLTETTGAARTAFVRQHARSVSGRSDGGGREGTISSDGFEDDEEADAVPFQAERGVDSRQEEEERVKRPAPGGRFPSDLRIPQQREKQGMPQSPSSNTSSEPDVGPAAIGAAGLGGVAAGGLAHQALQDEEAGQGKDPYRLDGVPSGVRGVSGPLSQSGRSADEEYLPGGALHAQARDDREMLAPDTYQQQKEYEAPVAATYQPHQGDGYAQAQSQSYAAREEPAGANYFSQQQRSEYAQPQPQQQYAPQDYPPTSYQPALPGSSSQPQQHAGFHGAEIRPDHTNSEWMGPTAAAAGVGAAGAYGVQHIHPNRDDHEANRDAVATPTYPADGSLMGTATHDQDPVVVRSSSSTTTTTTTTIRQQTGNAEGGGLGGLEAEGARETGTFPTIVRHNTDMSVSGLHVPGEFPWQERR